MSKNGWEIVVNKKDKKNNKKVIQEKDLDPIIARRKENQLKLQTQKNNNQNEQNQSSNPNQDWNYITIKKENLIQKKTPPQMIASSIKENKDGEIISVKKISKSMAKAVIDARVAKKWSQIDLAHNSSIDVKTIGEIERGGCIYDANIFNKLCKTLGVKIERNYDLV